MTHPSPSLQEVNSFSPLPVKQKLSRRNILRNVAGLILMGSLALLYTACGPSGTSPTSKPSPTPVQTVDVNAALHGKTNPYPPYTSQLVLDDPLDHDNGQWPPSALPQACVYQNGKYVLTAWKDNGGDAVCPGGPQITGDFTFQVEITFVYQPFVHPTPNDDGAAGIAFGRTANGLDYFLILLNQQGKLTVNGVGHNTPSGEGQLAATEIAGFKNDQPILLAVVIQGHQASIYVNLVKELTVTIPTLGQGRISLQVDFGDYSYIPSAAFRNARLWI